jgi:hypothetical protein
MMVFNRGGRRDRRQMFSWFSAVSAIWAVKYHAREIYHAIVFATATPPGTIFSSADCFAFR